MCNLTYGPLRKKQSIPDTAWVNKNQRLAIPETKGKTKTTDLEKKISK